MRGRWLNFDDDTLVAEMATIPQPDRGALFYAMDRYAKGEPVGFEVKDYGDDLYMIKAKGERAGRCLFFTFDEKDRTTLVALMAYKKGSQKRPEHLIRAARERRGRYIERRRGE